MASNRRQRNNTKYDHYGNGSNIEQEQQPIAAAIPSYGGIDDVTNNTSPTAAAVAQTVTIDEHLTPSAAATRRYPYQSVNNAAPVDAVVVENDNDTDDVDEAERGGSSGLSPIVPNAQPIIIDDEEYSAMIGEKEFADQAPVCRDVPFAVLFYIHFALMIWLGIEVAPKGYHDFDVPDFQAIQDAIRKSDSDMDITDDQIAQLQQLLVQAGEYVRVYPRRVYLNLAIPLATIAFFVALFYIVAVMRPWAKTMVYGCLIESFLLMAVILISGCIHASSGPFMYIFTCISLASIAYYGYIAWRMVPFAAVNLKVAVRAISRNCGIFIIAFFFAKLGLLWVGYWFYVVIGTFAYKDHQCQLQHPNADFDISSPNYNDVCDPPFYIVVAFLLSLYWTTTVTMNMIQVTVAGAVATWCYAKEDANCCFSAAVCGSLYRSLTYSFGSVCLGSLLQAFVSLFRCIVEMARNQRDRNDSGDGCCGSLFLCILECLASLLEEVIYFFNQYAYIYAGIYGLSYIESGRKVMDLFRARGWTTIITNNLVGYVLSFSTFTIAVLVGLLGVLIDNQTSKHLKGADDEEFKSYLFGPLPGAPYWSFGLGFVLGLWVCMVMMNVVKGAVNTVIVCWADSPTVMEVNHPTLTREMAESWTAVFPDIGVYVRPTR